MTLINEFGEYAPIILIFLSVMLLWNSKNFLFYYILGITFNTILNLVLKGIIQEPRPIFDDRKMKLVKSHAKHYFFQNGIPFDMFGMPSGHAQASFFSTIYIYLTLKRADLLAIYIISSLITCYQRVVLSYHSILQIIVGGIIGTLFAYLVYNFACEKIKGKIKEKPDDNGPV